MVTIAYWDTEGGSRPPRLLGDYSGTPTIRLFKPKKNQRKKGSNAEKDVTDYQHGERNLKDMRKFLEYQMPNYVERVKFGRSDYDKVGAKANKFGLPIALVFTSKGTTSTTVKWLSTEFRRKLLIVEIPPTTKNEGLRAELVGDGGDTSALPALYVLPPSGSDRDIAKYDGDKFSRRKLEDFLKDHALLEPVLEPIVVVAANETSTDAGEEDGETETTQDDKPTKQSVGGDEF